MPEAVEVIHIFLASPGDLLDERQIARDVVDEVNECIRSLSTQIVLLGWEDTRPGVGRPQQIINKDVDRCDLFVGLMWRHWGTATGTHSSGFEEEFERARERHAITGSPEMWLSFKSIGDDHLKDPGAQLRRVIDFRQQQIDRRDFLFSDFDDSEEWKGLFRRWLLTFVLERTRSDAGDSGAIASPVRASTAVISAEPASIIPVSPVPSAQFRQVAKFINSLSLDALRIQWPDKEGPLVVAHLQVTASAAMSITYPDTHLGVHEANLLYSSRKDVILAAFERVHIIRSVVADDFRRVPGWYWFSGDIGAALFAFAADHESVAKNALDILRMAKILPAEPYVAPIISQCLRNASLREAALDYLAAVADPASIEGLAAQNDDDAAAGGLLEAAVAARLRRGDESVTEALEEMRVLSDRVKSALTEFVATASAAGLLGAVVSRHEVLRKSAIKALALGGNLVDTLSFSLLRDPSTEVRSIVYESLLAAGAEIDLVAMKKALEGLGADEMRSLVVSYYRRLPLETLLVKLEYYGEDSTEIYEAAALQYPKDFLGRVRRDLRDQMVTFQEQWSLGLRRMFSDEIAQSIEKAWADNINVVTFVRNRYTAAALRALGVGGEKGDLYFGQEYITHGDALVRDAAARVVGRFGTAADAGSLVEVALKSYGGVAEETAVAATNLSGHIEKVILPLLKSGNPTAIRPALARLRKTRSSHAIKVLSSLLRDEKASTRVLAAAEIVKIDPSRAEEILEKYQQEYRYYDVVCWLDRLLFAPVPLLGAFYQELSDTERGW